MKRKLGTWAAMWDLEVSKFNSISVKKRQRGTRRLYRSKDSGMEPVSARWQRSSTCEDAAGRPSRAETWWASVRSLHPSLAELVGFMFMPLGRTLHFWDQYLSPSPDITGWLWFCGRWGTTVCLLSVSALILLLCVRRLRLIDTVVCPNPFPLLLTPGPLIHAWILETFLYFHCIWTSLKIFFRCCWENPCQTKKITNTWLKLRLMSL